MPTAKYLPADVDDIEDVSYDTDYGQQPKTHADSMLDELLSDLNDTSDNVQLRILRQTGSGKEAMQFVEAMPPDKYNADELYLYLRESYGPGDYRIQVRRNGKIAANKLISIAAKKAVSRENTGDSSALLQAIQAMQDQISHQNQAIARMMQQPQGNNKKEFLEEMMLYKQLFSDNAPRQSGGVGELLQSVEALKTLGINVGVPSAGDDDEGFGGIIEKMSPLLMAALQGNQNQQPPAGPQSQPKPNPQQRPENDPKMFEKLQLKMGVQQMVNAARKGADPSLLAEFVTNTVDQTIVDKYLTNPQAFKMVCSINKDASPHESWFNDMREHINALYGRPSKFSDLYQDDFIEAEKADINDGDTTEIQLDLNFAGKNVDNL